MSHRMTVIDLFAGAGGLSLGFEQAGFEAVLGTDNDERAMAAYEANFPRSRAVVSDVTTLTGKLLLSEAGLESCTAVIGGPPCQAFSIGGLRRKTDKRRGMVTEFARLVCEIEPDYFALENVPGMLLPGAGGIVEELRRRMASGGYSVADPWLLDAADFGVPQRRQRVFVVGARTGLALPHRPLPSVVQAPSAREAIGDLEPLEDCAPSPGGVTTGRLGPASTYSLRLRGGPRGGEERGTAQGAATTLTGCARVKHAPAITARFASVSPGSREPISRFFRLHPDRPAPTLRAGTLPENGKHTAPRPIHYAFPRCITVREAARLHSMPDWFQVDTTKWRGFMQVGNAVPPLLARAVALAVRRVADTEGAEFP